MVCCNRFLLRAVFGANLKESKVFVNKYNVFSAMGLSTEKTIKNLKAGNSSLADVCDFVKTENFPVPYVGIIKEYPLFSENFLKTRVTKILYDLLDSLNLAHQKIDSIVVLLNSIGTSDIVSYIRSRGGQLNTNYGEFFSQMASEIIKSYMSQHHIKINESQIMVIDNTCTSGNSVLGIGYQGIKLGFWKNCLAITLDCVDLHSLVILKGLNALSLNQKSARSSSRPFDIARDGFVKSDGVAAAFLGNERTQKRAFEILSFSQTNDAYRLTDGREDALMVKKAITLAIEEARIKIDELAFFKAHGTATQLNDKNEMRAIDEVFYHQQYPIPVTSLKGHLGHTTDASGLVETILAAYALQENMILNTLNCEKTEFKLDIVKELREEKEKKLFLSNTAGFGGNNSSLIIRC